MKNSAHFPFKVAALGILIALVLPRLMQDGMFTDGVLYAAVAHNMANGLGAFWHPYFNETMFPFFHQQPPLTFGLQALFFKIFGDSIYVERMYSFLTLLLSAWIISNLWKCIYSEDDKTNRLSWLPVIFWIIIPVCLWSYSNNMEENTMGVFTLLSVLFVFKGLKNSKYTVISMVAAGICSSLAFLCKGFPGLFVVSIPFLYWLCIRSCSFTKMLLYSLIITGTIGMIFLLLQFNSNASDSLHAYLNDRVINSIKNVSTGDGRFYLIKRLFFIELLSPIALAIILLGILKWKSVPVIKDIRENKRVIILFLLIGVSASFPLIITLEQRGFYLVPSFPYYAIAISSATAGGISLLIESINTQSKVFSGFRIVSALFVAGSIAFSISNIGTTGQNAEQLHDVYMLGKVIPRGETIEVFPQTWQDWGLHNYFVRYFNISMSSDTNTKCVYFLAERSLNGIPPPQYSKVILNTLQYDLYKRRNR